MEEKKSKGRPKKTDAEKLVTLNLRVSQEDRSMLKDITKEQRNSSDTDTVRRLIRAAWKPKK